MLGAMDVATPRRFLLAVLTALVTLVLPGQALAIGGSYTVDGGTPRERAQVQAALDASAFDWGAVRTTIRIHVRRGTATRSTPGQIWVDSRLLDAGRYSWGFVQHEYAHQVDFFNLQDRQRDALLDRLGGVTWWWGTRGLAHEDHGCERFASSLAWAYWPSPDNALRPTKTQTEAAAIAPGAFRRLLQRLIGREAAFHR
jgi:hypothetical protein